METLAAFDKIMKARIFLIYTIFYILLKFTKNFKNKMIASMIIN